MPWWLIGTAFVATGISSEQMIGTVGSTYQWGMGIANWEWFGLPGYTLVLVIFIPIYLKNKVTTVPGFLADRFGPACGTIYSCMLLVFYVCIYMATVLYSGSLAFSQITQWNFYLVLWIIVVGVGAYSIHGGLTSVMWADLFQCLLLMAGGITLFFCRLGKIPGGWAELVHRSPDRMHLYQGPGHEMAPFAGMLIAVFGAFTFYQVGNQAMIQRMLAARTTWDALMGLVLAQFINFFRPLVTCFLGLVVWHWISVMHQDPSMAAKLTAKPDLAFTFALDRFAPAWGVRGVVVAGLIAAVMATLSAQVNSASTLFSSDVYKKLIRKGAGDREMVRVGRLAALAVLLLAAVISPIVARWGIFKFFQFTLTSIAIPFMATVLMGVLWKRVNYPAAVFGLVGGTLITASLLAVFSGHVAGIRELHFFYIGGIAEVLTMIGIAGISLATAPPTIRRSPLTSVAAAPRSLRRGGPPALVSASEVLVGRDRGRLALSLLAILVSRRRVPLLACPAVLETRLDKPTVAPVISNRPVAEATTGYCPRTIPTLGNAF